MTPAGLQLRQVTKRLGGSLVLDGLSLDVADGEMLVLVGPSGSGKSTLLRVIAGLVPHDAGEILINGRDVGALAPAKRNAAMVFQSYALFPHMSIAENLTFGLRARGAAPAQIATRVADVSSGLGIGQLLGRFPRELSGGERQRVALGRAMLREPAVFLMDEPLSNLDAQLRVQTRAEIVRLHDRLQTTTVYVTHDQLEALSMGDRIGVLNKGRIEQIGPPHEIYRRPRTVFVARFIGTPAMNTFVVQSEPPDRVRWQGQSAAVPQAFRGATGDAGRPLLLGVRPEHIFLEGSRWAIGARPADAITAAVDFVELAGDQLFVRLSVGEQSLIARTEPEFAVKRGDRLGCWFDTDALHLFDPDTGESLPRSEPS